MDKVTISTTASPLEKMYAIADALNIFFKDKKGGPYEILARLLEEAGEVSTEVSRLEGNGIKRSKGEASSEKLADEIVDVMKVLLQLIRHYGLEAELEQAINRELDVAAEHNVLMLTD